MQLPPSLEMREELGRGASGVVFRAYSESQGRDVAVKVLLTSQDASLLARFQREGRDMESLFHPNVVAFYEMGSHQGHEYLVMEFVEGNLNGFLQARPNLAEVCRVFAQIARGLGYIHSLSIVHRDVKPENILMTKDWVPKITDFGLARRLDGHSRLTADGTIVGTFGYLAPEQMGSSRVTHSADLYALGVCLYEAVTGRPPFEAETDLALIACHLREIPPSARLFRPDLPVELEHLLMRLLRKQPEERPASAEEVARLLEDLCASLDPSPQVRQAELRGRQEVLDALEARLSQGPAAVVLTAPAGSGRSRLLRELALRLAARGGHIVRIDPEGNQHQRSLQEAWTNLGGHPDELWAALHAGPLSAAAHLARRLKGSILMVDDLDRLEPTTRAVLSRLASMPPTGGLLLSCTGSRLAQLRMGEKTTVVELPELARQDLQELAEQIVAGWPEGPNARLDPALAEWLVERSAGSPRRLKLLLLSLRGSRGVICQEGLWQRVSSELLASLEDAVLWEIERLDEVALALVRFAALLDEPIPFALLEKLGTAESEPMLARGSTGERFAPEQAVEKLVRLGILEEIWTSRGDYLRFSIPEVRQRLANGISPSAARRMHARIARTLQLEEADPARVGRHLALAHQPGQALPLLTRAAEDSLVRGAFSEAFELWDLANRCGGGTLAAAKAGECLVRAGRLGEAEAYLERTYAAADDEHKETALRWLALLKARGSTEARQAVRSLVAGCSQAFAHLARAMVTEGAPAHESITRALRALDYAEDRELRAAALLVEGTLQRKAGSLERARQALQQSLNVAPQEDLLHRLETLYELGSVQAGRESTRACYQEALALAEELGELPWQARLLEALAQQSWQDGELEAAAQLRTRSLECWRRTGSPRALPSALLRLAELHLANNQYTQAEGPLREALQQAGDDSLVADATLLLGWSAQQQGRLAEASEHMRHARRLVAEELGELARARVMLADVWRAQGQLQDAGREATSALELQPEPLERGLGLAVLGLVQLGLQRPEAVATLASAQATLAGIQAESPVGRKRRLMAQIELQEALERLRGGEHQDDEESTTLRVEAYQAPPEGIEVLAFGPDLAERRVIWRRPIFAVGGPGKRANDLTLEHLPNRQLLLNHSGDKFFLTVQAGREVQVNGEKTAFRPLEPGDRVELGAGWTLQLSRECRPVAWLMGCTEPCLGQHWELGPENILLGRKGRRLNQVVLEDATVSRAHARLRWVNDHFQLEQECSNPTRVNGLRVAREKPYCLRHHDLIQVGYQLLRFGYMAQEPMAPQSASLVLLDLLEPGFPGPGFEVATACLEGRRGRLLPFDGRVWAVFEQARDAVSAALEAHARVRLRAAVHTAEIVAWRDPVEVAHVETLMREGLAVLAQVQEPAVVASETVSTKTAGRPLGQAQVAARRLELIKLA